MGNPLEREMDRIRREQQAAANAPLSPVLPVSTPPRVRGPEELAAQLRAANQLGRQKSQQESAEAIRLSQRLGLPAEVVASDLEAVRTQEFQRLSEDIAKSAPVTASWGAEPTRASAVGQSGWEKLSRIERIFGTGLSEAFLQARQPGLFQPSYRPAERDFVPTPLQQRGAVVAEFARSKANFDLGNYQFLQTPASRARPEVQREIDRLRQRAAGFSVPDAGVGAGAVAEEAARSVANIVASITEALEGSAIGAAGAASAGALGALTAGPAAVPAAGVLAAGGAATGSAARIYQFSSGLAIDQFLQAGIDPEAADALGRTVGLGSAALEVVGLNRIGKLFGLNGAALASRVAQRGLQDLTTRRAVMEGVKAAAGTIAVETGTEVAQQALQLGGEQVGRMMSDLPSITGDRVLDELWTTAYTTVLGMGLLAVPGAAITTVNELGRVEQAKKAQDFLTALGDSVESTELRTQMPEQFQQLLQQNIDEYGPVQNVSIPVDRFVAYWQERNLDPRVVAEQILGDTTAYDQALEQGTADVVIPLADFVAKVAGTEHYAGLLPDIRLRPGDLTVREAEALAPELERSLDELRGDLETAASTTPTEASAVRVYEAVLEQIVATGQYTAEQARPQAQVIANLYSTMARRANLDPFQLWQSRNISILSPVQAEVLYDAVAEMEEAMAENPSSPRAVAAVQRVEQLRTEMSATPAGAAVAEQVLTPMVMPISAVDIGQRVVLADGRSAVVTGREAGNVVVRMAGAPEGETTPIAGDREVQVPGAVLRQARAVPTPRLEATANLRAVFDFARKNQFRVNRDFKLALQARAQEAAAEDGVDLTEFNTATLDYLVRVGLADAEYAMETNPNAIGWYERKVREALAISALTYPEIETDQNARFAFIVALAVTSNGMKVDKNFELADQVYRAYRETGQMPTNVKAGTAQGAMNTAFKLFNELVPLYGMDTLRQAMITQFDVGTLKAMGFKITGEHVDVIVRGAAIFGPKIGNGFFANLYGFFDALTIDRWLMRTWGRWTGNLVEDRPDMVAEKSTELARLVAIISQNAEAKQTIEKMLKLSLDAPIEDIGKAVQKASAKENNRDVMNELMLNGENVGEQLRLVGNSLAGYLDGQIEAPTADVRKKIRGVFQRVLEQLQVNNPDLTMADLQALLWYPEKRLYDSAVMEADEAEAEYADDEAPDYSNAAAKLARSKGITEEAIQDVLRRERAIDGRTAAARRQLEGVGADPAASADVEGLSRQARRNFVARSVLRRLRSDIAGDGTKSETYARKGRGVRASLRLLGQTVDVVGQYTPSIKFRNRIEAANGTALEFFELAPDATSAQVFTDAITAAKNSTPFGAAVFVYAPEDYAGMRLFVAEDGQTGFALKPDGDIVSVFSYGVPGGARGAIELAIQQGGRKLDAFATVLPEYYFAHGMREVARLPWDDTQAPPDWDTNTFADFNDGRPDVVFMVFDPEFSGPYEVAPYAADYGAALAAQDRALADLDTRVQPVVAPQVLRQAAGGVPDQSVAQLVDRATDPRWVYEDLPETIDVDGVTRPTRNSLGQQITFNAKAMRAFWRWFGDSKVVDAQGRPIMMYHGTVANVDFDTFRLNPREMGVHTGTPEQATDRVRALSGDEFMDEAVGPRILELYVKADNPLRLEDEGGFSPRSHAVPQLVDLGILSVEQGFELSQIPWTEASYSEVYNRVIDALRERGYDSIVYFNQYEGTQTASGGDDSYIVFTKQQVKSPVNVGTFSPRLASTLRQEAYHGSPYLFGRFSLSAVGTGEGLARFGWGINLTRNKGIAAKYRDVVSDMHGMSRSQAVLYKVDIADAAILKMLEWEKPLSQQKETVQLAVRSMLDSQEFRSATRDIVDPQTGESLGVLESGDALRKKVLSSWDSFTGEELYRQMYEQGIVASDEAASKLLLKFGVPGIKHILLSSTSDADTFVVFDENLVSITERNGQPVSATERASLLGQARDLGQGMVPRRQARPNAFIIPGIRRTTIGLMNTADLSSLMHEFSHDYLNLLFDLAATDGATDQLKADAALVLQTFGVTDRTQLTVEHQESWARMFEAYLEEGKAPSRALDRAFARFRAWLSAIYRMARSVLVPVSPEIRGVFDRMLATEAEIDAARTASVGDPLFGSAEEAGMTDAEFAAYLQKQADARAFSEATLLREMLAERRKETRAAWQERREEVEEAVRLQVEAEPVQQVVHFLRTGELLNGDPLPEGVEPVKLSKALLVQRYGEEVLRSLPKGVYSVEGGVDPDVLALSFGIQSGDALITEMQAFEPYKARVKRLTAEVMAREFPDLMNDSMALANAAMAAVHRSETDQVLVEELRILGRSDANIPPTDLPTIKRLAREIIGGTAVRNINRERFRQAELSAGRKAYAAMRRGDASTAAFHKRQQLLNHILYREATRALEMAEKTRKFFARMAKGTTQQRLGLAGWEYQERMNVLLAQYEFVRVSLRQLDRRSSLQAWIEQQRLEGIDVEIPLSVLVNDIASQQLNYRLLTADQLQGVYDSGQQIYYIATRKNALLADAKKRAMQQVEDEVVASIAASHEIKPRLPDYVPSPFKRLADFLKKIDAWHIKPEFLFTWLDGEKPMGPVWSALFKPIADAGVAEAKMLREALPELERLFNMIPKARRKQFLERSITVPGTDAKLTGSTVLAMALNWGNEGNREALLQSTVSGQQLWTREMVEAAFRQLTADEWRMVQAAWDYIDTFWPQISALQRELTGVSPQKIEASPFVVRTADGETIQMRGGYYPLVYDRNYNWAQFKADAAADVKDLGATTYTRAVTRHGFTEQRVGSGGRPVKLDLSVLSEHVLNVIHDLTHRKAILDVGRLIERPGIREAIEGAAGREMYRIIRPWLQRVASDQRPAATPIEDLLGRARTGVTVVNMGLKMTTAIVQPIGYLQTVESLGVKYARRGLQAFFRNPKKLVADVLEQSAELRARQQNFDRDVRDSTRYLAAKGKMTQVTQAYFVFTGLMDMAVAIPSWYGAYLKSVETIRPGDHDAAVAYADQVVRTSQGSGASKDLALIQGGGNAQRLFTLFYSYFSALYNLMRRSGTTLAREGSKDVPRFIASMALLWFLPAVLSELIAGRGPEDDEDEMGWALTQLLRYPASTIVGLRDIAAAVGPEAYDYELSPVTSAFRSVVKTINNAGEIVADAVEGAGVDISEGQLKEFLNAVGYWGQLPTRQMWITGAYLYDVMMGYETPDSVGEFTRNLLFARPQ